MWQSTTFSSATDTLVLFPPAINFPSVEIRPWKGASDGSSTGRNSFGWLSHWSCLPLCGPLTNVSVRGIGVPFHIKVARFVESMARGRLGVWWWNVIDLFPRAAPSQSPIAALGYLLPVWLVCLVPFHRLSRWRNDKGEQTRSQFNRQWNALYIQYGPCTVGLKSSVEKAVSTDDVKPSTQKRTNPSSLAVQSNCLYLLIKRKEIFRIGQSEKRAREAYH